SRAMPANAQRARPLITVLAGYGAFSRTCELADGTVISPADVVPLLGDADIERIVFDGPSRVIDVGVRERFFTGALRRAIEVRDRHCTHASGCDVPAEHCGSTTSCPGQWAARPPRRTGAATVRSTTGEATARGAR